MFYNSSSGQTSTTLTFRNRSERERLALTVRSPSGIVSPLFSAGRRTLILRARYLLSIRAATTVCMRGMYNSRGTLNVPSGRGLDEQD